jgi:hypothetical protein
MRAWCNFNGNLETRWKCSEEFHFDAESDKGCHGAVLVEGSFSSHNLRKLKNTHRNRWGKLNENFSFFRVDCNSTLLEHMKLFESQWMLWIVDVSY